MEAIIGLTILALLIGIVIGHLIAQHDYRKFAVFTPTEQSAILRALTEWNNAEVAKKLEQDHYPENREWLFAAIRSVLLKIGRVESADREF